MSILGAICLFVRGLLAPRARLAAENLALRQQLAVFKHATARLMCCTSLDGSAPAT